MSGTQFASMPRTVFLVARRLRKLLKKSFLFSCLVFLAGAYAEMSLRFLPSTDMYAEIRRPDADFCCELFILLIAVSWLVSPLSRVMELKGITIAVPPYEMPVAACAGA